VKAKESEGILPINVCHMVYNHANEFGFLFYEFESELGYCGVEGVLLLQLQSHDIDQISRLFILGRMDKKNKNNYSWYCDVRDDSYIEAFKQRRPIIFEEKMLYLNGLNTIFGSEDRMKLNNIFFKEKHSFEETIELYNILKEEIWKKFDLIRKKVKKNYLLIVQVVKMSIL